MTAISEVKHTIYLSTNSGKSCELCRASFRDYHDIGGGINHYIKEHGYMLLHVGPETSHDNDGKPWHATVAVVGK